LVRCELAGATVEEIDVEAVLEFAESFLADPGSLWESLPVERRYQLQWAVFPRGLLHDGADYQTPTTSGAFTFFRVLDGKEKGWRPRGDSNTRHAV
jgi:hypothetical protein